MDPPTHENVLRLPKKGKLYIEWSDVDDVEEDLGIVDRLARARRRAQCREHLSEYVIDAFPHYAPGRDLQWNWHLGLICEWLEEVYYSTGSITVVINVRPRSLKTLCSSIGFSSWAMGRDPSIQFICGSYASSLSLEHSVTTRQLMETTWYRRIFPDLKFVSGEDTKERFVTTKRGHRLAASVGGKGIGLGSDIQVIDDPHNPKKALSVLDRFATNEVWLSQTLHGRYNNPKQRKRVICAQRLHVDDATGYTLKKAGMDGKQSGVAEGTAPGGDRIVHVKLPTEARKKTVIVFPRSKQEIVRNPGDLLHPDRVGPEENAAAKAELKTYAYAAQDDQEPVPLGGGRIKIDWFPRYTANEALRIDSDQGRVVISVDTADKKGETSASTAVGVYKESKYRSGWVLRSLIVRQWDFGEKRSKIEALANVWKANTLLIENKASGISLIQVYQKDTKLPVIPAEPVGDKVSRMEEELSLLESGRIILPEDGSIRGCDWLFEFESLLEAYPTPASWDELDQLSQFLAWVRKTDATAPQLAVPYSAVIRR